MGVGDFSPFPFNIYLYILFLNFVLTRGLTVDSGVWEREKSSELARFCVFFWEWFASIVVLWRRVFEALS